MRRIKPQNIKDLLQLYIQKRGVSGALQNGQIYSTWTKVVGENLASYTKHRYFAGGVLYCTIESSVARTHLNLRKDEIASKMNELLGKEVVKQIVIR